LKKNNLKLMEKKVEIFLKKEYPGCFIKKEFGRQGYAVRPDYAVFTKEKLIFVELKGNKDTLGRLARQLFHYQRVADSVILITDKKYSLDLKGRGIGTATFKKKKLKDIIMPGTFPDRVTDILFMLFSQELDEMLGFLNVKFNSISSKRNAIKAIYSQFEIRKYVYEILYSRVSSNSEFGILASDILMKTSKIEAFKYFELGLMI